MARRGPLSTQLVALLELFAPHCDDVETINELRRMIDDEDRWKDAHDLFSSIRQKTLRAERARDSRLSAQYLFEEVVAKTLYNLSLEPAPFDPDSPYWIIPNAFELARQLKIDPAKIVEVVMGD